MYLRHLHVESVKLLKDVRIDFVGAHGEPRMWTVIVGENRLCKTTLLQTIAAVASGRDRGTQLVGDVIASWPDLRDPVPLHVRAEFGFSDQRDGARQYPDLPQGAARPPRLGSELTLAPDKRVFEGSSSYVGIAPTPEDPLGRARSEALSDWFVAGYGPSRLLPATGKSPKLSDPMLDRLRPLFGESLIGTGFIDLLGEELGRAFAKVLQSVFVAGGLLPHVTALELRGRGGIRSAKHLVDAQRFEMDVFNRAGERIRVPATWLSQGYQSLIAWLADVVGQVLIEAGGPVDAAEMEGLVLVDEIDLHLHPTWQVRLIPALKRVFPRLQFVATTHSPMVLPGLEPEEVWLLSQAPDGSVFANPSNRSPSLLTGSELLSTFFEIKKLYPEDLAEKLRRYGNLASDPTRSDSEDATLQRLRGELAGAGITFDWEPVSREAP
ncbi:MAG: AAA family ATPase [Labilithrix sp.]|nr:AAA family ATPase [Labilithrix sp.]